MVKNYKKGAEYILRTNYAIPEMESKTACISQLFSLKYVVFHLCKTVRKELVHVEESTLAMPNNK